MDEETALVKKRTAEEIVALRNTALSHYLEALKSMDRAAELAEQAGRFGAPRFEIDRHGFWGTVEERMEQIRSIVDRAVWRSLKEETGLLDLMDAAASRDFDKQIEHKVPVVTLDAVRATFSRLFEEKEAIFERGVVNVFKTLSRDYRNNDEFRLGRKIVIQGGFWHHAYNHERVADLDRIFHLLDGKNQKPHGANAASILRAHYSWNSQSTRGEKVKTDYMEFIGYKNGNIHITFTRMDLVQKVNRIIARDGDRIGMRRAKKSSGL